MSLERNVEYQNFSPYETGFDNDPLFNPSLQYEQAYMYYRYLTQQVEYKIKCKEYDRLARLDRRE